MLFRREGIPDAQGVPEIAPLMTRCVVDRLYRKAIQPRAQRFLKQKADILRSESHTLSTNPNRSKLGLQHLRWKAMATRTAFLVKSPHLSDLAVRSLSPCLCRGTARRRRRPLGRRSLWRRALFRRALRRGPRGWSLRLAALLVRKTPSPACRIWSIRYFGSFTPCAVTPVEPHASSQAIYFTDSANASLVSAVIPSPPRQQSFFGFVSCAPSSRFLLQPLSAAFFLWMLRQRREPGLLL